jgi:chromosomal replication initiation ATPase DnaA
MVAVDMATETQRQFHENRKARLARFARAAAIATMKLTKPVVAVARTSATAEAETKAEPVDWLFQIEYAWALEMMGIEIQDRWMMPETLRVEDIQRVTARHFDLPRIELLSERRNADVVKPRQIAMYFAKRMTLRSYQDIGRRFGGRDHSTVLHAVRNVAKRCRNEPDYAHDVATIEAKLAGR